MHVVGNAQLVRDCQQKRVCLRDGLIVLELLDQHIRLRRIGPAKDRPSGAINVAELIALLLSTTEVGTVVVVYERKNAAADGDARSPTPPGPHPRARITDDPTTAENLLVKHGRGIYLMEALMDEVRYEHGGALVYMRKKPNARS